MATLLNNIAATLKNLDKLPDALKYHLEAFEMRKKLLKYES